MHGKCMKRCFFLALLLMKKKKRCFMHIVDYSILSPGDFLAYYRKDFQPGSILTKQRNVKSFQIK